MGLSVPRQGKSMASWTGGPPYDLVGMQMIKRPSQVVWQRSLGVMKALSWG